MIRLTRLRDWREYRLLSRRELARRAGVKTSTIERIERGVHRPRLITVHKLASALQVAPERLLEWPDGPPSEPARATAPSAGAHEGVIANTMPTSSGDHGVSEPVVVAGRLPDGYECSKPMPVQVWREGPEYVAAAVDIGLHAFGDTLDETLHELGESVVGHLKRLDELDDRLSPRLAAEREKLRALIVAVHA